MFPHASMVARVTVVVDESENGTVMISVPLGRLNSSSDVGGLRFCSGQPAVVKAPFVTSGNYHARAQLN